MSDRSDLLEAAKLASRLTIDFGFKERALTGGYTRVDPFALAEAVELAVLVRPLPKLLGAFLLEDGVPGILVNSARPVGMVRLTCAHELGHFFLKHDPHIDEEIEYAVAAPVFERAANEFAYHLLMPRWLIANVMRHKQWGSASLLAPTVVYQLALRLGVSFKAMVWSLMESRLLPVDVAKNMAKTRLIDVKNQLIPEGTVLPNGADVWLLDAADENFIIEPRANDCFLLTLPNHAGSGYMWSAKEASQEGFVIKPILLDPESTPKPSAPVQVGAPSKMTYLVEPAQATRASDKPRAWSFVERQPWDTESAPSNKVDMNTQFEHLLDGLSPGTRRRHLEGMSA